MTETGWLEADDLVTRPSIAMITAIVLADPDAAGRRCVKCGAAQADDARWPAYAIEVLNPGTGDTIEIDYRACPACEDAVDAALAS